VRTRAHLSLAPAFLLAACALVAAVRGQDGEDQEERTVRLRLVAPSHTARAASLDNEPPAHFLADDAHVRLGAYRQIYPGIDVVAYGNEHYFEYAFRLEPGAFAARIRLALDELHLITITDTGRVLYEGNGIDGYQEAPFAYRLTETGREEIPVRYLMDGENGVGISLLDQTPIDRQRLNAHSMLLVAGGDQPGGPLHDFFVSQHETTHAQFTRFLNDAEAHPDEERGEFMHFDEEGNVWFNEDMLPSQHEIFRIGAARLTYDPDKIPGHRYDHLRDGDGEADFAKHPITGVSWYGALKYCNWLTITSGRGAAERAYAEGTNAVDWAPVTAASWEKGVFSDDEREQWLRVKGFRLPMLHCDPKAITANRYNEFFKAAAWNGATNVAYGFGRDRFLGTDANAIDTINRRSIRTFPVGFFDGINVLDELPTEPNENLYALFDLSGNAAEWVTDFGRPESIETRALCGGSWSERLRTVERGSIADPAATSIAGGFRPITTFMPYDYRVIHMLYCFHFRGAAEDVAVVEPDLEGEVTPEGVLTPEAAALAAARRAARARAEEEARRRAAEEEEGRDLTPTGPDMTPPGMTAPLLPPPPPPSAPYVPPVIATPPTSPFIG